ncbi:unnamed protein product [Arctogadus glacialis]
MTVTSQIIPDRSQRLFWTRCLAQMMMRTWKMKTQAKTEGMMLSGMSCLHTLGRNRFQRTKTHSNGGRKIKPSSLPWLLWRNPIWLPLQHPHLRNVCSQQQGPS